jgi:hypothetical protein
MGAMSSCQHNQVKSQGLFQMGCVFNQISQGLFQMGCVFDQLSQEGGRSQ